MFQESQSFQPVWGVCAFVVIMKSPSSVGFCGEGHQIVIFIPLG